MARDYCTAVFDSQAKMFAFYKVLWADFLALRNRQILPILNQRRTYWFS
jgi:hypothetical protein